MTGQALHAEPSGVLAFPTPQGVQALEAIAAALWGGQLSAR